MDKIILFLVLICLILATGCAAYVDYLTNKKVLPEEPDLNLEGFSKDSILVRFGEPDEKKTSFTYDHRIDSWHYYYKFNKSVHIIFIDDYVRSVSYN
jgi:hypothetical protein